MESIFHWSIATLFGSFTLGNVHLLEGDQIGSWHWSIWRVIWRSLDYFMLSSLHTRAWPPSWMFWHRDLISCLWLLLSMGFGAIDTLGLVFLAYLDDLRYLHTFHFTLKHFTLDVLMPSITPEPDHHLILSYTSHRDTWPHPYLD